MAIPYEQSIHGMNIFMGESLGYFKMLVTSNFTGALKHQPFVKLKNYSSILVLTGK